MRRETWEETGIEVGEVVYHSSQPWPGTRMSATLFSYLGSVAYLWNNISFILRFCSYSLSLDDSLGLDSLLIVNYTLLNCSVNTMFFHTLAS